MKHFWLIAAFVLAFAVCSVGLLAVRADDFGFAWAVLVGGAAPTGSRGYLQEQYLVSFVGYAAVPMTVGVAASLLATKVFRGSLPDDVADALAAAYLHEDRNQDIE